MAEEEKKSAVEQVWEESNKTGIDGPSPNATKLIKEFERYKAEAYEATEAEGEAGKLTIGWGSTLDLNRKMIQPGQKIDRETAERLLGRDMLEASDFVKKMVKVPLSQNEFDALVSLTYNTGAKNVAKSNLLKKLNAGKYDEAAKEFWDWNKQTVNKKDPQTGKTIINSRTGKPQTMKVTLDGLTHRRVIEESLFRGEAPKQVNARRPKKFQHVRDEPFRTAGINFVGDDSQNEIQPAGLTNDGSNGNTSPAS